MKNIYFNNRFSKPFAGFVILSLILFQLSVGFLFTPKTALAVTPTQLYYSSMEAPTFGESYWSHWESSTWQQKASDSKCDSKSAAAKGDTGYNPDNIITVGISTISYTNLNLTFWYKIYNSLESSDHVYVQWSSNGTTWYTLYTYTNLSSGNWIYQSLSLPSGAENKSNLKIRFSADLGSNNDEFRLDCVELTGIHIPFCGDQIIEGTETCDGNSQSCTTGEGYAGNESCNAQCSGWNSCVATEFCGDGQINGPEICEVNDTQPCITGDGYSGTETCLGDCSGWSSCVTQETCGDDIQNGNEECDDGPSNGIPYVPPYGQSGSYCSAFCTNVDVDGPYCGDGNIDQPDETCEGPDTSNNTSCGQSTSQCDGNKTQIRDEHGDCDGTCNCVEDNFGDPVCIKDSCGAACAVDEDCDDDNSNTTDSCNLSDCSCENTQIPPSQECGNQVKEGDEECDGADGVTPGENFCTWMCQLVPIYDGQHSCPEGTIQSEEPVITQEISSRDADGEIINIGIGNWLLEVIGTFSPTGCINGSNCGPNYFSDAGYTTINNGADGWVSQYGIQGTGNDYAAHALLSGFGTGTVGVVDWGEYNPDHVYTKYYNAQNENGTQFVIGDRWSDWFTTPWQNQGASHPTGGVKDNGGYLTLNVYECVPEAPPVECPKGTDPVFLETVSVPSNGDTVNSINALESGIEYLLQASGLYKFANWGNWGIADAEWSYRSAAYYPTDPAYTDVVPDPSGTSGWVKGEGYFASECGLDVQVNGCVDWGNYNPGHVYKNLFSGTGAQASFYIYDNQYADNEGSLDVDIYECRLPAVCEPGVEESCPADAVGACAQGTMTCDERGQWGSCVPSAPTNEDCNNDIDDDCDGATDWQDADCQICDPTKELITNGGFETPIVSNPKNWNIFNTSQLASWFVEWMPSVPAIWHSFARPITAFLELQKGAAGDPNSGLQLAELDSDWAGPSNPAIPGNEPASVKIYQDINTISGRTYAISYYFSARPNTAVENNRLEFTWDGIPISTVEAGGDSNTFWTEYQHNLTATSDTTRIQFSDVGNPDSYGTYLDDVSVRCQLNVCEDGFCDAEESCEFCPQDCNECQTEPEPLCGNGTIESGEECDDGNNVDDDGCSANCTVEELIITDENSSNVQQTSFTITWVTNHPATSRVIYDTVSHLDPLTDPAPNYGYAYSTAEDINLVTNHSVVVSGLIAGTTYYFRAVSHGSPEVVGDEISEATSSSTTIYASTTGGGGGGGTPGPYLPPGEVAGESTEQQGEVLGESTEQLPTTGSNPFFMILFLMLGFGAAIGIKKLAVN